MFSGLKNKRNKVKSRYNHFFRTLENKPSEFVQKIVFIKKQDLKFVTLQREVRCIMGLLLGGLTVVNGLTGETPQFGE